MSLSPPPGFVAHREGQYTLLARESQIRYFREAGLDDHWGWREKLARPVAGRGRGAVTRWTLPDGTRAVLKKMLRGGWAGPLWRRRFTGTRRLMANLSVPAEAARRGVPTAAPLALLLRRRLPGLYEGWLAVEEIPGVVDLHSRLAMDTPPGRDELKVVLDRVREMHDAGVEHQDLTVDNLLVRRTEAGEYEAFVIDLDRAVLHPGPLPFAVRQAGLRRLERSYLKRFPDGGSLGPDGDGIWYELYAEAHEILARQLEAGRGAGRAWLALHRIGWRR